MNRAQRFNVTTTRPVERSRPETAQRKRAVPTRFWMRLGVGVLTAGLCVLGAVPAGAKSQPRKPAIVSASIPAVPPRLVRTSSFNPDLTFAGPYTTWDWPDAGYTDTEERLTISRKTTPDAHLFWAHQFGFVNGDGGYIGLQEGSNTGTKIALFSIWSANGTRGRNCGTFSGEGTGRTCRIDPYNWKPGRTYELEVHQDISDTKGTWWTATVLDTVTGVQKTVGSIRVPLTWGGIQGWVSWTEDFYIIGLTQCSDLPHSQVVWQYPTAEHGTVTIAGHTNIVNPGDCQATIKDVPGGVLQLMRF